MRKSRFAEEQIIAVLKEAEAGMTPADLVRKHGITAATFYRWRSKYGGWKSTKPDGFGKSKKRTGNSKPWWRRDGPRKLSQRLR